MGLEAYRRALEKGETFDRRTKIVFIGQDRAGKTSLRRYLRGEAFVKDEASTPGIEMLSPVKNAGKGAWRNPDQLENTSALDHKCAEVIAQDMISSCMKRPKGAQLFTGEVKKTRGEPTSGKGATPKRSNDPPASKEVIEKKGKLKLAIALTLASFFTESRYFLTTREVTRGWKKRAAWSPVKMNGQTNLNSVKFRFLLEKCYCELFV